MVMSPLAQEPELISRRYRAAAAVPHRSVPFLSEAISASFETLMICNQEGEPA
jgi:hypothetical protein